MMWLSGMSILSSLHLPLLIQRGVFVVGVVMHGANSKETGEVSHTGAVEPEKRQKVCKWRKVEVMDVLNIMSLFFSPSGH